MDLKEALEIVETHNAWRRGADFDLERGKILGIAIDTLTNHVRQQRGLGMNGILEQAKKNLGKNTRELALHLGVVRQTLSSWEKHNTWPQDALVKCGFQIETRIHKKAVVCRNCGCEN